MSRREALTILMRLSDAISAVEQARRALEADEQMLGQSGSLLEQTLETARKIPEKAPTLKIDSDALHVQARVASILHTFSEELGAEGQELLGLGADMTRAQLVRMVEVAYELVRDEARERAAKLAGDERRLRDILELVAGATDEGG
jgi:hypothetical protein